MRLWNGSCRGPEPKICNCNLYVSWSWGSMGQFCKWICPESIRSTANLHHVILQELGIQTRGGIGNLFGSRLWGFSIMVTAWIFLWCYPPDKCYSALVTSSLLYSDLSKENSIACNDMLLLIQASSFFYHLMLLLLSNERPKQRVCRTTPQCFQAESEPTLVKSGTVSPTLWEAKNSLENGGCELLFVASAEVNQTCIYQTNHSSLKTFFSLFWSWEMPSLQKTHIYQLWIACPYMLPSVTADYSVAFRRCYSRKHWKDKTWRHERHDMKSMCLSL